jgi:hypothetical protein
MVDALPRHVRCTVLSAGQNLFQACFGGTVPVVAVYLIAATGYALAPALYLVATAAVSFIVILTTEAVSDDPETAAAPHLS